MFDVRRAPRSIDRSRRDGTGRTRADVSLTRASEHYDTIRVPPTMSGHHQDWKEITIGKRPSSTGGGSAKAAKDPKAVAAVRARDDDDE